MRFPITKRRLVFSAMAILLCLAVLFPQMSAFAQNNVDPDSRCSLEIMLRQADETSASYEELKDVPLTVRLYRVAEMAADGSLTAAAELRDENGPVDLSAFPDGDAESLEALTDRLASCVETNGLEAGWINREVLGSCTFEDLPVGLYLVLTDDVVCGEFGQHLYRFQPSLISLPTTEQEGEGSPFRLVYDARLYLKKDYEELYGSVIIRKILDAYHENLETATFVFSVEAEKDGQPVYSNVLSLAFREPGVKQTVVDRIPVGSVVTVTEIYSGASYKLTSDRSVTVTIDNPDHVPEPPAVTVTFENTYDGGQKKGTSVVNHFEYNAAANGWSWTAIPDNEN